MMKAIAEADEKKRKWMMPRSAGSGSFSGASPKYRMVYTPPGVNCVNHNSSKIGAIAHNSNHGSSSSDSRSSSSIVPLLPHGSRLPSSHHNSFPPATFYASIAGKCRQPKQSNSP
jgi:hypothetical protein